MIATKILGSGGGVYLIIGASVRNPDVRALALAAGWNGYGNIELRINAGVDVANLIIPATIPNNCLTIVNNGRIGGMAGGTYQQSSGLVAQTRISVDNRGQIFSAGAQGGNGGDAYFQWASNTPRVTAYGGGGGTGAGFSTSGAVALVAAQAGVVGTYQVYDGDVFGGQERGWALGGKGATGAALGSSSANGEAGTFYKGSALEASTSGGIPTPPAANPAVQGNSLITWISLGTITGPRA